MEKSLGDTRDREYNNNYSMDNLYTTKVIKVGTSKAIIIPVNVLSGLGWLRGDRVIMTFGYDDSLIIKKLDDETIRRLKNYGAENGEPLIEV